MTVTDFQKAIGLDWPITLPWLFVLICSMCVDVGLGLAVAFGKKGISSTISREGMCRKAGILGIVFLAAIIDGLIPPIAIAFSLWGEPQRYVMSAGGLAAAWFLLNELISVTEKAAVLKMPMPRRLAVALIKARDQLNRDDSTEDSNVSGSDHVQP